MHFKSFLVGIFLILTFSGCSLQEFNTVEPKLTTSEKILNSLSYSDVEHKEAYIFYRHKDNNEIELSKKLSEHLSDNFSIIVKDTLFNQNYLNQFDVNSVSQEFLNNLKPDTLLFEVVGNNFKLNKSYTHAKKILKTNIYNETTVENVPDFTTYKFDNEFTVNVYNSNFILLDKFSFNKQYSKNLQGYYPVEEITFDYNSITLNNEKFNALITKHENFEGFITKTEVIKGQKLVKGNFGLYNSFKLHDKVIVKKEVNGEIKPIILEIIDLKSTECWLYTNESDFDLIKPMDKVYRFID